MTTNDHVTWLEANQRYLTAALKVVRTELEYHKASAYILSGFSRSWRHDFIKAEKSLKSAAESMPSPAALDRLVKIFGLSSFEQKIILMCAGVELDSKFATLVSSFRDKSQVPLPSFSLALSAFQDAHWSALMPDAPLRYWRLVEIAPGQILTMNTLKIDESILSYLTGIHEPDDRIKGYFEPLSVHENSIRSQDELAGHIAVEYLKTNHRGNFPIVQLNGENLSDKENIAANVISQAGLIPYSLKAVNIPASQAEINELARLWNRQAAMGSYGLYLNCNEIDTSDPSRLQWIAGFCEKISGVIMVGCLKWSPVLRRSKVILEVNKPVIGEQMALWKHTLGEIGAILDGEMESLVSQFDMSAHLIRRVSAEVVETLYRKTSENKPSTIQIKDLLWEKCCAVTRPSLDNLAQRIKPVAVWENLILPETPKLALKEIAMQVRQRLTVYETWGFAANCSRGLGITVLFTGESGTGKTMASEVLANDLHLDLYRIDLSQVVNKYIGETEKNLKKIFDAAEDGGAILLFDEADALFGKRSEVKDSHDRYANIEVSYLLQRMESYRGLAILTTNLKSALDKAFLRRLRFIVQFPFPDTRQRKEIWQHIFPDQTPTEELDWEKLARLNIAGGNIRNIAMNAAFIAANEGLPVSMSNISRAARSEYAKLEKPMSTGEMIA